MPESRAAARHSEPGEPERFRHLPDPVRLEDTIASEPASDPPDPTAGRNSDQYNALHSGG